MKEAGVDMEVVVWYGVLAPAATPPATLFDKLAALIARAAHDPDIRQRLLDQRRRAGRQHRGGIFEDTARRGLATWAEAVKASGLKADQ